MKKIFVILAIIGISARLMAADLAVTITNNTAGNLKTALGSANLLYCTALTVTGTIDARDFKTMRDNMSSIRTIDLSGATVVEVTTVSGTGSYVSTTYPANTIPYKAFNPEPYVESIILPKTVTEIGSEAFNCIRLTNIVLQEGLLYIDYGAFNCSALTSISIPASVIDIQQAAFSNCSALTSVTSYSTNPQNISGYTLEVFVGVPTLYVPNGTKSLYQTRWTGFTSIVEMAPQSIFESEESGVNISTANNQLTISNAPIGSEIKIYNINGAVVYETKEPEASINLQHGIYIVKIGSICKRIAL